MSLDQYDEKSSTYLQNKRFFTEFIDAELQDGTTYQHRITDTIRANKHRLVVNIHDIRNYNTDICNKLLAKPIQYIAPFTSALNDYIASLSAILYNADNEPIKVDVKNRPFSVALDGEFGMSHVSPRDLSSIHLNTIMCVDGIATRCSVVRPKVLKTVHYCADENQHTEQTYHDATSVIGLPTGSMYPTQDSAGHRLTTEFGLCKYIDHQTLALHEMPERTPAGLLPSAVDVVLDDDLVDLCKPGDRIQIVGIYRSIPAKQGGVTTGLFRTVLIANNIKPLSKTIENSMITDHDIKNIRKQGKNAINVDILANSIAPSIQGHGMIKKALLLQLLSGVEKNLENGTHIRGDINILMCGDPSTAKSQLLRFTLSIAPLAINTTGRGSSGVGLTAAVLSDRETGERRLEAGAMVLADRGIVCIDEFDKMSDADRVAIHEVMEQQTVTIAKAGIHMSLNARCSVLAAANPKYSQYDSTHSPAENVALPDSLLSRFDLLFIVLDTPDKERDGMIAVRVIQNHRYLHNSAMDNDNADDDGQNAVKTTPVYAKDYGANKHKKKQNTGELECLSIPFLKKYIEFAKATYQPILTDEATEHIAHAYTQLRNSDDRKSKSALPVTARTLETMIRLSTAHAKARLNDEVTIHDCEQAIGIMMFALQNDTAVVKKRKTDTAPADAGEVDMLDEAKQQDTNEDMTDNISRTGSNTSAVKRTASKAKRTVKPAAARVIRIDETKEQEDGDADMEMEPASAAKRARTDSDVRGGSTQQQQRVDLSPDRVALFKRLLNKYMTEKRVDDEQLDVVLLTINQAVSSLGEASFTREEAEHMCVLLAAQNLIMWSNGRVWKI